MRCWTSGAGAVVPRSVQPVHGAVGMDLSEPAGGDRAAPGSDFSGRERQFVIADAQTHIFGADTFDVIISQFGSCSSTIR